MGRLTDGSFNMYGTGSDQIDIARENRINNPAGNHSFLGVMLSQNLPSIFMQGVQFALNASEKNSPEVSTPSNAAELDREKDINNKEKEIMKCVAKYAKQSSISENDFKTLKGLIDNYYSDYNVGDGTMVDYSSIVQSIKNKSVTAENINNSNLFKKPAMGI